MVEETKRRGRPASSGEVDPQSSICTIKDPSMEPFYIIKDPSNFIVMEKSKSTRGFGGKAATGKEQENVIGYYSNFSNALNRIAKEKFYKNKTQRGALGRLLKKYGENNVRGLIQYLGIMIKDRYAKKIITPLQLEDNLGLVKAHYDNKKNSSKSVDVIS
jgi:hypothetical protein